MTLRRGFKTEANEYARELRVEIGLAANAPLSPWLLAEHLEIPVMRLSELESTEAAAVKYLTRTAPEIFSAATLFAGYRRLIVHNDAHHPRRQAADLAHEISHAILGTLPRRCSTISVVGSLVRSMKRRPIGLGRLFSSPRKARSTSSSRGSQSRKQWPSSE
jgi:hypothetical protein